MTNIVDSSSDDENHILNDAMANTEQYNAVGDDRLNVLDIDSNYCDVDDIASMKPFKWPTVQITFIFIGQTCLHLCYETLKRVSNFSELA